MISKLQSIFQKGFGPIVYNFFFSSFYFEEHEGHLASVTFPTKQTEIEQGKKLALENI